MKPDGQESAVDLHRSLESQRIALIGQHPIIDRLEQIESKFFEHLIGRSVTESIRRKPEDPFTGRIEVRDQTILVDGEQTGGDRLDHRLDVGTAAIEFKIAVAQRDIGLFDLGLTPL